MSCHINVGGQMLFKLHNIIYLKFSFNKPTKKPNINITENDNQVKGTLQTTQK